jgi:hypothetical protein
MPAKCTEGMKRDALYKCYPEEIEIREDLNGRHDKPDIGWLITDILNHGQMQAVGIWDDAGTPVLAYGFSRWRAISEINLQKLTPEKMHIKCVYIRCNEQGAFIRNIAENRMRNPVSAIDDAHNIQRLFDWTMDEKDVAKIYFPNAATEAEIKEAVRWIQARVSLIKLTPEAEEAMRSGRLSETAAQAIAKLSSSQQKATLKSKEGKLTGKDIKSHGTNKQRAKKPVPIDPELRLRINAVVESAQWEDYDESKTEFLDVKAAPLAALKNYIAEK